MHVDRSLMAEVFSVKCLVLSLCISSCNCHRQLQEFNNLLLIVSLDADSLPAENHCPPLLITLLNAKIPVPAL